MNISKQFSFILGQFFYVVSLFLKRYINFDERWHIHCMSYNNASLQSERKKFMAFSKILFQRKLPKPDLSTKTETCDSTVPRKTKGCLTKILSQYKKPYVASTRYWLIPKKKISYLVIFRSQCGSGAISRFRVPANLTLPSSNIVSRGHYSGYSR